MISPFNQCSSCLVGESKGAPPSARKRQDMRSKLKCLVAGLCAKQRRGTSFFEIESYALSAELREGLLDMKRQGIDTKPSRAKPVLTS